MAAGIGDFGNYKTGDWIATATMGPILGPMGADMWGVGDEDPPTPWEIYKSAMKKIYPVISRDADRQANVAMRENTRGALGAGLGNTSVLNSIRVGAQRQAGAEKQDARGELYKQAFGLAEAEKQKAEAEQGDNGMGQLMQMAGMIAGGAFGGPAGAMIGSQAGGMLGGAMGPKQPQMPVQQPRPWGSFNGYAP